MGFVHHFPDIWDIIESTDMAIIRGMKIIGRAILTQNLKSCMKPR